MLLRQPGGDHADDDALRGRSPLHPAARPPHSEPPHGHDRAARLLIVSSDLAWVTRIMGLASTSGIRAIAAATASTAISRLAEARRLGRVVPFDVALVDGTLVDGCGIEVIEALASAGTYVAVSEGHGTGRGPGAAARAGACASIDRGDSGPRIIELLDELVGRCRPEWCKRQHLAHLCGLCGGATASEVATGAQRRLLFDDQLRGTPERQEQMNQLTIANEFGGLIRHELDIESLLRTTLEFVLAKCGPTNAAVFLPTTSGDYSLGAYVNYDCIKETVDVLLDHLANSVAPKFENRIGIAHLTTREAMAQAIGHDAGWLDESEVVAFCCRHDGEVLAICLLFRDRHSPFTPALLSQLQTVGELFADQLARVIRIHHRHLPKEKWGAIGDADDVDGSDEGDLAA
ncbi:MAG: hypothetical protein KF745_12245 [Phycisphaeraceae bacterium]|nr:hypothetical protein [Phycisphaeraceae bacterium]